MQTPFLDELVKKSWEILPGYSSIGHDLKDAVSLGEGSCAHRSTIIGRKALEVGVPAMRSIYFGWDNVPTSFRSLLFVDGVWQALSTDHFPGTYFADRQYRRILPSTITWSRSLGGLLLDMEEEDPTPDVLGEIVIPENLMAVFQDAKTAIDYLSTSKSLL